MSSRDLLEVSEEEAEGATGVGGVMGRGGLRKRDEQGREAQVTGSWQGFIHTQ